MIKNDLATIQQYQLTERDIAQRKFKIRIIAKGTIEKYRVPWACHCTHAFGEHDIKEGGGGLENHPWQTTGTLYSYQIVQQ